MSALQTLQTNAGAAPEEPRPQEPQDVWEYLAEHIDEFAVAKTLCDHFEASPQDLQRKELDYFGLYMRARVTIKRQQIAYAQAQATIDKAARSSRSLRGRLQRVAMFASQLRAALQADPRPALVACGVANLVWLR